MQTTPNLGLKKIELNDSPPDITVINPNWDKIDTELDAARKFQTAGGTGTAIILVNVELLDGFTRTFVISANNGSAATTINAKPLYKPGTTTTPKLITGKAVTVWYSESSGCFFIKASAEGDVVAADVLAGKLFSNDDDTGLVGEIPSKALATITPSTVNQTIASGQYLSGIQTVLGDADLISANIKAGANIFGVAGNANVVDTSAGDAVVGDVLLSKKVYVDGALLTGTMPNNTTTTTINLATEGAEYTIPAGKHGGLQKVKAVITGLIASVIKAGTTVGGILGTFTSDATAVTTDILSGKTGYVNGAKITGTMVNRAGSDAIAESIYAPAVGGVLYFAPPEGYYKMNGMNGFVRRDDPNFIPANIIKGKTVMSILGTAPRCASGTTYSITSNSVDTKLINTAATAAVYVAGARQIAVTGLTFKPRVVSVNFTYDGVGYCAKTDDSNTFVWLISSPSLYGVIGYAVRTIDAKMLANGFTLPTFVPSGGTISGVFWDAWE